MLILVFAIWLGWLPSQGSHAIRGGGGVADALRHLVLPALALSLRYLALIARITRTGMIEALSADYIRTARAKGLPRSSVLFKHALRNAILPVVSVAAVQFGVLLGGSIVIESVFALNGIGLMAWDAINRSDYPVLQGIVLIVALLFVLLNLAADVINALLDPRLKDALR